MGERAGSCEMCGEVRVRSESSLDSGCWKPTATVSTLLNLRLIISEINLFFKTNALDFFNIEYDFYQRLNKKLFKSSKLYKTLLSWKSLILSW